MLDDIANGLLSYFLCEFNPKSKKVKTKDLIREIGLRNYSAERVEEFIESRLLKFQATLVEEFNTRFSSARPLRFQIADALAVGEWVKGNGASKSQREIAFQDALHKTSSADFEKLAAIILRRLNCASVFFTPSSHDQGVDAFGYQDLVEPTSYGTTHKLTWIAQAKHYLASKVTTGDLRELVGSKELLVAKIFSTVDERYRELNLHPYAPTALALITSEEVPSSVRRLAERAGLFVFAASDIYHILSPNLKNNTAASIAQLVKKEEKSIHTLG